MVSFLLDIFFSLTNLMKQYANANESENKPAYGGDLKHIIAVVKATRTKGHETRETIDK